MREERSPPSSIKIAFVIMSALFFVILVGFAWVVTDVQDISNDNQALVEKNDALVQENQNRIDDIQASRVESCRTTYEGIRKVFKPFFPEPPRTKEQQTNLDKFNNTINTLQEECTTQTDTRG